MLSYGGSTERMTVQELEQGKKWLNDTFHLIRWVSTLKHVQLARQI